MLAPEDERRAIEALRFSLASDIVELVVLTADDPFLLTLREAVGPARRLWHVPSSDKVGDLLLAGGVGILVLDIQAVKDMALRFISEIKRQFPDLVVVVAGTREDETALARLISDGTIYRFIHKPMSPARARLFADAAVKKYDEQRKTQLAVSPAAASRGWVAIVGVVLCAMLAAMWIWRESTRTGPHSASERTATSAMPADGSPSARAAQALAANRLTEPAGESALDLYRQQLELDPGNAAARAGLAEVHERLLSRAENALLEERLEEASADLDAARSAGVDAGRVAFLAAELTKARARLKASATAKRAVGDGSPDAHNADAHNADAHSAASDAHAAANAHATQPAEEYAALAIERIHEEHLIEPDRDNARFFVEQALKADASSPAALDAREQLALALLTAARTAMDRRDFAHASDWLNEASDLASPDNLQNLRRALETARHEADLTAEQQLLKSAEERLRDDRLIEPENDSAKYYLTTLRGIDPGNPGLAQATQQLGARLVGKGRYALTLEQYEAARSWLEEAAAIGYAAPDAGALRRDLDAALARKAFSENVINASQLELVKSVVPVYPHKAEQGGVEGWVELDFTVAESGSVKDVVVRGASPAGTFEQAAVGALLQWHYKPVVRDAQPIAQRARIRIRFALPPHE